jgi:hypothetical protein
LLAKVQLRLLFVALFLIASSVGLAAHVQSCASSADHAVVSSRAPLQAGAIAAAERKSPDSAADLATGPSPRAIVNFGGEFAVAALLADTSNAQAISYRRSISFVPGDTGNTALAHRKITVLLI